MSSLRPDDENYERILRMLKDLPAAADARQRRLEWVDSARHLAVARDESRRLEIFLPGPPLDSHDAVVRANLSHTEWEWQEPGQFAANRLVLPSESHFDAVAAFVCTYLIDNGVSTDIPTAFARSEPVIALALVKSRILGDTLVGLWGELLVLRALLEADPLRGEAIVDGWLGHGRTSRDFLLGGVGVEVKTTRGNQSTHRVSGLQQVSRVATDHQEQHLFLVSIGVAQADGDAVLAWTLPGLIDDIVGQLRAALGGHADQVAQRLLTHIHDYGAGGGQPYNHQDMRDRIVYGQAWRATFTRWYDMDDPLIDVPRREVLAAYSMIDPDSVELTVRLPRYVDGELNPISGLRDGAQRVRQLAWPGV